MEDFEGKEEKKGIYRYNLLGSRSRGGSGNSDPTVPFILLIFLVVIVSVVVWKVVGG